MIILTNDNAHASLCAKGLGVFASLTTPCAFFNRKAERENEYVFQLPKRTGFRLGFLRIIKASGIKKSVTFHTSRRTFATLTLASGSDLTTVSRLLGHSSVTTTEIYADVLMDSKVKAINGISDLFK